MKRLALLPLLVLLAGCSGGGGSHSSAFRPGLNVLGPASATVGTQLEMRAVYCDSNGQPIRDFWTAHTERWYGWDVHSPSGTPDLPHDPVGAPYTGTTADGYAWAHYKADRPGTWGISMTVGYVNSNTPSESETYQLTVR